MKINTLTVIDTEEFESWARQKYGMDNNEWHEKIWRPYMCGYFDDTIATFHKYENPVNIFQEHINAFLADFSELNDTVKFIFTN